MSREVDGRVERRPQTRRRRRSATTAAAAAPRTRRRRLLAVLAVLGPGLIAANAGNDAGGIATYASAGAQFGYRTLFIMLLVTVALVVVQEMSARLGAITGEGLVSLIREQFPLRAAAVGGGLPGRREPGPGRVGVRRHRRGVRAVRRVAATSACPSPRVAIWAIVVFGSYRYAERVFLLLGLAFVAYPIAAVLGHPHWEHGGHPGRRARTS